MVFYDKTPILIGFEMKYGVLSTFGMLGLGLIFSCVSWAQEESWKISDNNGIEASDESQDTQEPEPESVTETESESALQTAQSESGIEPYSYAAPPFSDTYESKTDVNAGYQVNHQQYSGNTSSVIQGQPMVSDGTGATEDSNTLVTEPAKYWQSGVGFVVGLGPEFDVRDPGAGLAGRIGFGVHGRYFGISLDVSWTVVWAYKSAKRSDALEMPYKVSNAGVEAVLGGYIPVSTHVVLDLGVGFGFGNRHETIFSNYSYEEEGASWLSHFYAGAFWTLGNWTLGMDLEVNLNNYVNGGEHRYWSDGITDVGIGLVFKGSYQINEF